MKHFFIRKHVYATSPFRAGVFTTLLALTCSLHTQAQIIITIAGDSTSGYNSDGIPAVSAELNEPIGIALDASGNLYICDRYNNRIRKVSPAVGGVITTIAGTGVAGFSGDDSAATAAKIGSPYGIAVDAAGNVYFSDDGSSNIRKINTAGIISTIAGTGTASFGGDNGPATAATFNVPGGIAIDGSGNIYIADYHNNRIRKINTSGIITTVAGGASSGLGDGGSATSAVIASPEFVAVDGVGNIYVSDNGHNRIRKVSISGIISTIAGNGTPSYSGDGTAATASEINHPFGIAVDGNGNIYICDAFNNRIRKVNSSGIITTIAGTGISGYNGDDELAIDAELSSPVSIAIDGADDIYISDAGNNRIRFIRNTVFVNPIIKTEDYISIYPNPCRGHFISNISSATNEQVQLIITNTDGQKIKEITANTNRPIEVQLDEPDGIYFLSVTTSNKNEVKRILLAK